MVNDVYFKFCLPKMTWARSSAGEHLGDIEGVVGSNPTAPTMKTPALKAGIFFGPGFNRCHFLHHRPDSVASR